MCDISKCITLSQNRVPPNPMISSYFATQGAILKFKMCVFFSLQSNCSNPTNPTATAGAASQSPTQRRGRKQCFHVALLLCQGRRLRLEEKPQTAYIYMVGHGGIDD